MKSEISKLLMKLYSGNINKEDFLKQYFNGRTPSEAHVLNLLQQAIINNDGDLVEEVMVLLGTGYFNPYSFSMLLCQLLKECWHTKHEDIAMFLKKIKSPETVDCLYDAAKMQLAYLEYDDTYQFSRKCIKALSAIGNELAVSKLRLLSKSKTPEIAGYAQKELAYLGIL